jgi:NMD protein affecting ribosome stability and mRNA decay
MRAPVGEKLPTIKPGDLVRSRRGRDFICRGINADGSRELEDVLTGELLDMRPELLYLVRAAVPKPWPEHVL